MQLGPATLVPGACGIRSGGYEVGACVADKSNPPRDAGGQSLPHEEIFERPAEVTVRLPENKPETEREVEITKLI
jgi:hypothetical protein